MRILFIGCVESSKILLETLLDINADIVGVLTKSKSNFNADFYDLSKICIENNINYKYVDNINDKENVLYIKDKKPDVIYCFGWSQIIKKEIISIPNIGVVGFHPTELPQNRGRHPLIWALALGLEKTASTFFLINEGCDTGDIISQEKLLIEYKDNAQSLYNKVMNLAINQVKRITCQLEDNKHIGISQSNENSNTWRKRNKIDGEITWKMSSRAIYNTVRALSKPYPGAHFNHNNNDIKVWEVEEIFLDGIENIEYGKVIDVYSNNSFLIKVYDNCIRVTLCDDIILHKGDYI